MKHALAQYFIHIGTWMITLGLRYMTFPKCPRCNDVMTVNISNVYGTSYECEQCGYSGDHG